MKSSKAGWAVALVAVLIAAIQQNKLNLSRHNEREADVKTYYSVRQSARDALEIAALKSSNQVLRMRLIEASVQRQAEQSQPASWVAPLVRPLSEKGAQ